MTYAQSKWLYDILQEHGFEECVRAFEQNIETLGYDHNLNFQKQLCLQKLEVTTIGRSEYIQTEIGKYEQCLRESISMVNDMRFCDVYNIMKITWNYVLSKTIIDELKKELLNLNETEKLQSIMTENVKKYFTKAIEAGLMQEEVNGYKWLHNKGMKASLGYFLHKVFNPNGTTQIPYKRVESLFNVFRLDVAIDQALTVKKPQKWRNEIDTLFDD